MGFGANYFGVVDYSLVAATLILSFGVGLYHAIKGGQNKTSEDLLMGGRKMQTIPIAISMLVTYFSASTIIGVPAEIYSNGVQIFFIKLLMTVIALPIAALLFMNVLFKLRLTSVYEYFELRFDSTAVRLVASLIFILQMLKTTAIALYAPSIALEAFLGLPMWVTIVGIGVVGTIYTSLGGLKAVVWTDVVQFFMIVAGMGIIVVKGFIASGGVVAAFEKANKYGRLELFNWNVDPFERYNTLNFIIGHILTIGIGYGTNQAYVQRYSSLPTFREAVKAMAWNAMFKELFTILIICTGVSIFATYAGCDPLLLGEIQKSDQIVPYFFVNELAHIPGMMGIFTACLFSAVLSTVSSTLNSLAAVTWKDFFCQSQYFENMGDVAKGRVTCVVAAFYGLVTMGLAFIVPMFGSIFQISLSIIGGFGGTLGGCFLMGLFLPFVNKAGALAGMTTGLFATGLLMVEALINKVPHTVLPRYLDECPAGTDVLHARNVTDNVPIQYEWPEKIWTLSYILYPFVGCVITIFVGIIVSVISRCFTGAQPETCHKYLHPWAKSLFSIKSKGDDDGDDEKIKNDFKQSHKTVYRISYGGPKNGTKESKLHTNGNEYSNGIQNGVVSNGALEMKNM